MFFYTRKHKKQIIQISSYLTVLKKNWAIQFLPYKSKAKWEHWNHNFYRDTVLSAIQTNQILLNTQIITKKLQKKLNLNLTLYFSIKRHWKCSAVNNQGRRLKEILKRCKKYKEIIKYKMLFDVWVNNSIADNWTTKIWIRQSKEDKLD